MLFQKRAVLNNFDIYIFIYIYSQNLYKMLMLYSLFGDSENRENNYLKIRDLLSIALFNILGSHYVIHIWEKIVKEIIQIIKKISIGPNTNFIRL